MCLLCSTEERTLTILGFNCPTGIRKVSLPQHLVEGVCLCERMRGWLCVFRHTHTLGVFMLVYETKLCLYAQKVSPDPSHSVSLGTHPPSALLCISIFHSLAHALLILFLCSLTRETLLNCPLCIVKRTGRNSCLENLPLNHCSDNLLLSTRKKWIYFGSSELSWIHVFLISHCTFLMGQWTLLRLFWILVGCEIRLVD